MREKKQRVIPRFKRKKNMSRDETNMTTLKTCIWDLNCIIISPFWLNTRHEVCILQLYFWWSFFLRGFIIIAAQTPRWVSIFLKRADGGELGETTIRYYDEDEEALKRVIKNPKLQAHFFRNQAEALDNRNTATLSGDEAQNSGICGEWRTLLITSEFNESYSSTPACVPNRCEWKWKP